MSDNLYESVTRAEIAQSIIELGKDITFVVEGDIGSGKSALIDDLMDAYPNHRKVYFDMTQITDSGDFQVPGINQATHTSSFYPNESFGLHDGVPAVIMYDEIGKANNNVLNAILPTLVDRRWGNRYLHDDTIVCATTNLGAENVGDVIKPHARNRVTFARMEKPDAESWLKWAVNNNIDPVIMAWVDRNPQCYQSFLDVVDPDANPYIYHPKAQRRAFVTHRSITQGSKIMAKRGILHDDTLTHLLCGTIGAPAAHSMMTLARLDAELPTRAEIVANPKRAKVPTQPAGIILLVCQALQWVDTNSIDAWMTYMQRFSFKEAQALFGTQAVANKKKIAWMSQEQSFTDWAIKNNYMFGA